MRDDGEGTHARSLGSSNARGPREALLKSPRVSSVGADRRVETRMQSGMHRSGTGATQ
jgi:hypothetical protein